MLEIKNLHADVEGKAILRGLDLTINPGEVHAIMGPNGSGKSTLAHVISGRDGYDVTEGEVLYRGKNILEMEPEERAGEGVFLAFQYPVEIPGVTNTTFMKEALNSVRKYRGEDELDAMQFMKVIREKTKQLGVSNDMLKRAVNVGFSGGEKKRNDILQMAILEPSLAILDETDSGLDIDALKTVADGVNLLRSPENATLVITHYQRLLDYIVPDYVHVLAKGKIVKSGDKSLAQELEKKGYAEFTDQAA
ncbi:Fe-S cluster assembly ATPase SufC [Denitrobaculum tricleocarpae]|uniref:Fe-S cluster assembly ATPase SufC n=1 Tax=Denitrobaculum tricleocarpae TaxID=2591009 RepID=A0A545TPB2_9PROT|nr:Fe-S cluster assembly ATPase SufC [Denitrobaculum tricleocarpae]TQV79053.1 Fe-S cluster assembly ATPase SufC [Denitrobaculum tricleocarpae]